MKKNKLRLEPLRVLSMRMPVPKGIVAKGGNQNTTSNSEPYTDDEPPPRTETQ